MLEHITNLETCQKGSSKKRKIQKSIRDENYYAKNADAGDKDIQIQVLKDENSKLNSKAAVKSNKHG